MKRNYGIDSLRIVLMLMVVMMHVLGYGGVLNAAGQSTVKYGASWLMDSLAYCAVNCYALISGYVYLNSKYRLSSLVQIWLQVLLYSLGISLCAWILKPESFSLQNLLYSLFPVINGRYWYFTSYVGLFIMIPFLNAAIHTIPKEQIKRYLCLAFLAFSILPTAARRDIFFVNWGYSTFWLAFMYVIGACIRKYGWGDGWKLPKAFSIYLCCVLISWGIKLCTECVTMHLLGESKSGFVLLAYTSPTMVIAAVALFLAFKNMTVSPKLTRLICEFSPAAFGVYLIHEHNCFRDHFILDKFAFLTEFSTPVMAIGIFASAIAVFAGCLIIDWIRHKIFRWLWVKERLEKLEEKYMHLKVPANK